MQSPNHRQSTEIKHKSTAQNLQKVIHEVTRTNPLPFIKKNIDSYINQRKIKKKKKVLKIHDSEQLPNKSETDIKRYDEIYQSIAEIYKRQEIKKRLLLSPNKVLSHQKILQFFEPYKKQIEKLRVRHNICSSEDESHDDTPFSLALKQLGIYSQHENNSKNKMVPLKQLNSVSRSMPKKQFKEKLKPISESSIKIESDNAVFLNVEKMNLIDGEVKLKPHSELYNNNANKVKEFSDISQRNQELKKYKEYKINPQLFMRKLENSKNIQEQKTKSNYQSVSKREARPLNSIMKFYPSLRNNLKSKPLTSNQNLNIFSYSKQQVDTLEDLQKNKASTENIRSDRLFNQNDKSSIIGQDDQQEEGIYNSENQTIEIRQVYISQKLQSNNLSKQKQITAAEVTVKQNSYSSTSPLAKINRRKKFFNQLPFETYYYRDLLWKVNFSNDLFVETPLQYEHRLRVFIGKGNNSSMLLGLIMRRIWFAMTDKVEEANFVWTQLKQLPYFKKQQSGKTIPITQHQTQETVSQAKPEYMASSILNTRDNSQFRQYFETFINFEEKSDERFMNRQRHFKYQTMIKGSQVRDQKLQNHLINNYVIGNKKALFNTMSKYYQEMGDDVFKYLPLTFHIKNGLEDDSWYKFLKYYYKRNKDVKKSNEQNYKKPDALKQYNAWIVKPGENSNRGNGIQMCLTLEEIKNIIKKKQKYSDGSPKTYIVQSYIERPLLYQRRKFDIRHYMMMTCINGKVKGYFYRDGYVRTTSSQYNLKTNCGKIHLTNDAVQKNLPDYGKYEKGNKISYEELQNYMSKSPKTKGFDFYGKVYPRMKKIATDVMRACSGGIDPQKLVNNFQVFGMDFMIDSQFNVWLIEVNSNPCLELSCPLLGSIIPKMVQNALEQIFFQSRLTLDCIFPPPVRYTPKGVHYYKNLQQENKFQLVYDERIDGLYKCSMDVLDPKLLYEEDDTFEDDGDQWKED